MTCHIMGESADRKCSVGKLFWTIPSPFSLTPPPSLAFATAERRVHTPDYGKCPATESDTYPLTKTSKY